MCREETGDGKFAITRHLSSHMEEISLAALPGGVELDDESGSDPDSDVAPDDDDDLEDADDEVSSGDTNYLEKCCVCRRVDRKKEMYQCSAKKWTEHWYHDGCGYEDDGDSGRSWCGMCLSEEGKKELAELGIVDLLYVDNATVFDTGHSGVPVDGESVSDAAKVPEDPTTTKPVVAGGAGAFGSDYQAEWERYLAEENNTPSSFPRELSFSVRE